MTTLPRLAIPTDQEDVAFKPTAYPDLIRTIGAITSMNRTLAPAAAAFIEVLRSSFKLVALD